MQQHLKAPAYKLNLAAIRTRLTDMQQDFENINASLTVEKTLPSDEVIENLISGYALIDHYLANNIDLFAYGSSSYLLELNHTVLSEHSKASIEEDADQFEATKNYFYGSSDSGISQLIEWLDIHKYDSVWKRAAGVFTHILSQPQLFIEGNHRTGALIMSYILMREGHAPFVLSVNNAKYFFEPAELSKKRHKKKFIDGVYHLPKQTKNFAKLLKSEQNTDFILRNDSVSGR